MGSFIPNRLNDPLLALAVVTIGWGCSLSFLPWKKGFHPVGDVQRGGFCLSVMHVYWLNAHLSPPTWMAADPPHQRMHSSVSSSNKFLTKTMTTTRRMRPQLMDNQFKNSWQKSNSQQCRDTTTDMTTKTVRNTKPGIVEDVKENGNRIRGCEPPEKEDCHSTSTKE